MIMTIESTIDKGKQEFRELKWISRNYICARYILLIKNLDELKIEHENYRKENDIFVKKFQLLSSLRDL